MSNKKLIELRELPRNAKETDEEYQIRILDAMHQQNLTRQANTREVIDRIQKEIEHDERKSS